MIKTQLMDHQKTIVNFCIPLEYAGIFADYGVGKSLCALAIIEANKFKKVLIVSTKLSIETTWCDEIRKHTDFRFCILRGTAKQKVNLLTYALGKIDVPHRYNDYYESAKPMIVLINYESVRSIMYELQRAEFDAVFADESTKIKTFNSIRTMALQAVGQFVKHRYVMTGFPVTEALFELYSQIKFLDRGETFGNSYYAFLNRYFVRHGPRTVIKKRSINEILSKIAPFCIRITNKHLALPPARYKSIELDPTVEQKKLLTQLNETYRLEHGSVKIDTQYIFTLLEKSLEICDGFVRHVEKERDEEGKPTGKVLSENIEYFDTPKDEALVETLEEIDVRKNKVVVWCAFLPSLRKIEMYLKKIYNRVGVGVLSLTGSVNDRDVNQLVMTFQRSPSHNVLICTQKKAAESVTLTSSAYAIYYSNTWSNDLRSNSEARIRRKGSEIHKSILYIDLLLKGTIEMKVYDCLRKKKNLINELKTEFIKLAK